MRARWSLRRGSALLVAGLVFVGACGGDKTSHAKTTASTTIAPTVVTSDVGSLKEITNFARLVHGALPQFCGAPTYHRDISQNPKFHLPILGAQATCVVWFEQIQNFAFADPADVGIYIARRTAIDCKSVNGTGRSVMYGYHWIVRPQSATLVPANDTAHVLAAILHGTYRQEQCDNRKPLRFAGAWNEIDAINTLLQHGGVNCGGVKIDVTNALYRGTLLLDPKNKHLAAIHGSCAADSRIQVIGLAPNVADRTGNNVLLNLQKQYCAHDAGLRAIRGDTGLVVTGDGPLADHIGTALTTPVTAVCAT